MRSYETILVETANDLIQITLNRPDAMNALNATMFDELQSFFTTDHTNYSGRIVVITGSGIKAFAAGADIKELSVLNGDQAKELSRKGQVIFDLIENFHLPVIAAVNGFALGGGCELAMACHIRVASDNARFGQPEVNLGIIPGYGGTQRLVQLIGKGKALEFLLTGDMIKAVEAHRLGLVNYVVSQESLHLTVNDLASRMLNKGPKALSGVIQTVNGYFNKELDGYINEADTFGKVAESEDFKEGTRAFIEKRKPEFKGR